MDYTRFFNEFGQPKAKIDFITLAFPASIENEADVLRFGNGVKTFGGSIKSPKKPRWPEDDWVSIHDPSLQTLQFLLDEYSDTRTKILKLEVAIDFHLKDGSNDYMRLEELHSWLKVCLFPQRHELMRKGYRKFYEKSSNKIKRDTLETRSSKETVYWTDIYNREQVRLYIKTIDGKKPIERHCVRLEITLFAGGCQRAKLFWIGNLPRFFKDMRSYLSPFFNVAKGIKPELPRVRSKNPKKAFKAASEAAKEKTRVEQRWNRYGAAWAAKHRYKTVPDAETNRFIGRGLGRLQDRLKSLKLTQKVPEDPDYEVWKPA
ncbi:MAG: hypothetical protein ABIR00_07695 [Nitrosospira sp.]